jgi:hypothetical protein
VPLKTKSFLREWCQTIADISYNMCAKRFLTHSCSSQSSLRTCIEVIDINVRARKILEIKIIQRSFVYFIYMLLTQVLQIFTTLHDLHSLEIEIFWTNYFNKIAKNYPYVHDRTSSKIKFIQISFVYLIYILLA